MLLGIFDGRLNDFAYGAVTLYGRPFQAGSAIAELCDSLGDRQISRSSPTTPT